MKFTEQYEKIMEALPKGWERAEELAKSDFSISLPQLKGTAKLSKHAWTDGSETLEITVTYDKNTLKTIPEAVKKDIEKLFSKEKIKDLPVFNIVNIPMPSIISDNPRY